MYSIKKKILLLEILKINRTVKKIIVVIAKREITAISFL